MASELSSPTTKTTQSSRINAGPLASSRTGCEDPAHPSGTSPALQSKTTSRPRDYRPADQLGRSKSPTRQSTISTPQLPPSRTRKCCPPIISEIRLAFATQPYNGPGTAPVPSINAPSSDVSASTIRRNVLSTTIARHRRPPFMKPPTLLADPALSPTIRIRFLPRTYPLLFVLQSVLCFWSCTNPNLHPSMSSIYSWSHTLFGGRASDDLENSPSLSEVGEWSIAGPDHGDAVQSKLACSLDLLNIDSSCGDCIRHRRPEA